MTRILDTRKAAEFLGLSRRTLENKRQQGGGPIYIKLGRSVRYRETDLEQWVMEGLRKNTSATEPPGEECYGGESRQEEAR